MKFKEAVGTGANQSFANKYNQLIRAINNMEIKAPASWGGIQPVVSITPQKIILDFSATVANPPETGADPYYDDTTNRGGSGGGSSGEGLPDGSKGDILYHDGSDWQNLSGVDDLNVFDKMVLQINGTSGNSLPEWDFVRASNYIDTP